MEVKNGYKEAWHHCGGVGRENLNLDDIVSVKWEREVSYSSLLLESLNCSYQVEQSNRIH